MRETRYLFYGIFVVLFLGAVLGLGVSIGMTIGPDTSYETSVTTEEKEIEKYESQLDHERAIISVVEETAPAVVSVVATKDVPLFISPFEEFFAPRGRSPETGEREIAEGTGFIISSDGFILTNRHVVEDEEADYTVFLPGGEEFQAKVLARDPVQDIAVLKIEETGLPTVTLGNSDGIRPGQTAIAIGNALGEFRDTVSTGVISGLGRRVTATDGRGRREVLEDVIQTDAAINMGNSGGPLLNLKGEVIGINTAMAAYAQNIGFAIPINRARRAVEAAREGESIIYPFIGIHYLIVDRSVSSREDLPVEYGALLISNGHPAITPDSPADEAGLEEGDIILKFDGEKITEDNSLMRMLFDYYPGDEVEMLILRDNEEKTVEITLGERKE